MNWKDRIPGCQNFYWYETIVTTHNQDLHTQEFLNLPESRKKDVKRNIIHVANLLQLARNELDFSIPISSWWRSARVEKLVGGSGANHPTGGAVDPALSGKQLQDFLNFFAQFKMGIGRGLRQGHIDLGPKRTWPYGG